jgi:hypothetical protein
VELLEDGVGADGVVFLDKVASITPKVTVKTERTCITEYLLPRMKKPKSMETARPALLNTIKTVSGTLNANAQLFNSDPVVCTRTWDAHWESGTARGFRRGRGEKDIKLGKECTVMNNIWEKVSADPILGFIISNCS